MFLFFKLHLVSETLSIACSPDYEMPLLVSTHKMKKKQKRAQNILSSSGSPWPNLSQQRWLVKPLVASAETLCQNCLLCEGSLSKHAKSVAVEGQAW